MVQPDQPIGGGGGGYTYTPPSPPAPTIQAPSITTVSLPQGALNTAYSDTLSVVNGTAPYHLAVSGGALPAGLSLSTAGVISGTPTVTGTFNFVVTVTDSESSPKSGSTAFTLIIPASPSILNTSLPVGSVGIPYFASLSGTGGAAPYGFQVTAGSLPSGLALATTGGLTGTPTTPGTFAVTVEIYDSGSPQGVATSSLSITIQPASITDQVTALDQCVIFGATDGGVYMLTPGQMYDQDVNGNSVGFTQRWQGVPTSGGKLQQMQLGGATVSAKGSGNLYVSAIDGSGNVTNFTTERRPMILDEDVEVVRDFMAKGVPHSERYGIAFDNGGEVGSWFELHVAILWMRPFFGYRKA